MKKSVFLLPLLMLATLMPASAGNIVQNPDFEAGSANWTVNGWTIGTNVGTAGAHSGTMDADTGCVGAGCIVPDPDTGGAWLYQDLATVPGQTYSLTFWFASDGTPMELMVLFDSTTAVDLVGIPQGGYIQYSNTTTMTASSSTTRLEFLGRQDPGWNSLDDIDVEAVAGVPEPMSFVLAGAGLAAVGLFRRKRSRSV
jgi:hypothetical protein